MEKNTKRGLFEVHLAVFLFGVVGVISKVLTLPSAVMTWGRVFFSSIFLFFLMRIRGKKIRLNKREDYVWLIASGVVLAVHWTSYMQSIKVSTVAVGTLSFSTFPLFTAFLEPIAFKEKMKVSSFVQALIMLAGILCIVPEFDFANSMTQGVVWGLVSALTYAGLSLVNRKFSGTYEAIHISFYEQATAVVVLLPFLLAWEGTFTVRDIVLLILFGTVFTAVAHSMFISGLGSVKVQTAGIISGLESVYGIAAAALFLHEFPGFREVIGGLIILGVVFYSTLTASKERT